MDKMTDKEKLVYNTICKRGITKIKDISEYLHINDNAVKTHLMGLYEKLDKHSIADLIFHYWNKTALVLKAIIEHEFKGK